MMMCAFPTASPGDAGSPWHITSFVVVVATASAFSYSGFFIAQTVSGLAWSM
jgi:hypothetical protein